ncbi:neurotransmitter:Na+ symporter, NSS family [Clostridium cavendishii DSM 21758]|uniref:Transporter n=1 Tax=Clostridium cavendishii DSM 21758 TaxID=1121302 RepID=A0A1M6PGB5_9CLOT|nr:sodium-dependent transporter [Clostridium cavendishii]SHK06927.1 neurotransmitter:Na+ symporter, NSS family [Clostridium cavendishii DSM 21758]
MSKPQNKEGFSSALTIFFATLGSAIGLGNIWKFPYLTGVNGGAAFIIIYLGFVLILGIPLMLAEFYIGRSTGSNPIGAFDKIKDSKWPKANKIFKVSGVFTMITSMFVMFYYSAVAGWVYSYLFKAIKGDFNVLATMNVSDAVNFTKTSFTQTVSDGKVAVFWQFVVLLIVTIVLAKGVQKGIEKVTSTLMPVLLVLIVVCDVRALMLSKAGEGISFLMKPDFSKVSTDMILTAMGLAFFKLAIAMGVLIVFSGYYKKDTNLIGISFKVAISDVVISIMAGLAIFPVVFEFGLNPSEGAGLLFQSIPLSFAKLPMGNILLIAFFLLTAIAATTAMISLSEVPVRFLSQQFNISRKLSVIISTSIMFLIGALTVHPSSIFGGVRIFNKNLFDFFDFTTSNVLIPITGLLTAIFVGYVINKKSFVNEITNEGALAKYKGFVNFVLFSLKVLCPILIILIFISSFK